VVGLDVGRVRLMGRLLGTVLIMGLSGSGTAMVMGPTPLLRGNSSSEILEAASDRARERTRTASEMLVESVKTGSGKVSKNSDWYWIKNSMHRSCSSCRT